MHSKNKIIWITGASSGIGKELARQLAVQQARLILTARNTSALEGIKKDCEQSGACCAVLEADMLQPETLPGIATKAIAIYGAIDVVIFCAGQSQRSLALHTQLNVYRQLMEVNFFAPVILTKSLQAQFQKQEASQIVVIGSMAGLMGFPLRTGYAAAKHALKGFFETLQTEHNIPGLSITIISPGRINTPLSVNAVTGDGSPHGQMDEGQLNGIPVKLCAKKIIKAMAKRRRHLIIAKEEKVLWWLWWFMRPLYYSIARVKGKALNQKG
ncbi:MAG: SDR family oxidoreductase [Ginsengibacter sp.]